VRTLDKYFQKELQTLYLVIKVLLVSKNVHKPWKGGIGSFVLINLITAFLEDEYKKKLEDTNPRETHYLLI
jgi:DNA polymerase sigma